MKRTVLWFAIAGAMIPILLLLMHQLELSPEHQIAAYKSTYGLYLWPASILLVERIFFIDYGTLFFLAILIGLNVGLYVGLGMLVAGAWKWVDSGYLAETSLSDLSAWMDRHRVTLYTSLVLILLVVWIASQARPEGIFALGEAFVKALVVILVGPAFAVAMVISGGPHGDFTLWALIAALTVMGLELIGIVMLVRYLKKRFRQRRV